MRGIVCWAMGAVWFGHQSILVLAVFAYAWLLAAGAFDDGIIGFDSGMSSYARPRHCRPMGLRRPSGVTLPGPGKLTGGTRGEGFRDIHLNATTRWKDVPESVWNYTLGGYQVLKKWLSYRESVLLGSPLSSDEAQSFTHNVRRITAILALHGELVEYYQSSI